MRLSRILFVVFVFCVAAIAAPAQITTGNIIGIVHDESGAVLPGVTVTVSSEGLPPQTTITNERGEYRFIRLQPGMYALAVELPGFSQYEETDLRVLAAGTIERIVALKVASVAAEITVSGQAPVVDVRTAGIQNSIPAVQLQAAASERYGVQAYLAMLPGVTTNELQRVRGRNRPAPARKARSAGEVRVVRLGGEGSQARGGEPRFRVP